MVKRVVICLFLVFFVHSFVWAQTQFSVSDQKEILEFIKEKFPEKYEEILELRDSHSEHYKQSLMNAYKVMQQHKERESTSTESAQSEPTEYSQSLEEESVLTTEKSFYAKPAKSDVFSYLKKEMPGQYNRLQMLKDNDPQRYQEELALYKQTYSTIELLKKNAPEDFERIEQIGKEFAASGPVVASEEKGILSLIAEDFPGQYKRLLSMKESDPAHYQKELAKFKPAYYSYVNLKKNNPEIFERLQNQKKERSAMGPVTASEEEEILSFMAEVAPEQYKSLIAARKENPQRYQELLKNYRQTSQNYKTALENYPMFFEQIKSSQAQSGDTSGHAGY